MSLVEPEGDEQIVSALKHLLLPISDKRIFDAVPIVRKFARSSKVNEGSVSVFLQNQVDTWIDAGGIGKTFEKLARLVMAVENELGNQFAGAYFKTIRALTGRRHLLTLASARGLLSDALLIRRLLVDERMSSAQVARVLNASQNTDQYTWGHVQLVASALGERPALSEGAVEIVSRSDEERDDAFFADADLETAAELLALRASELGYRGDLREQLQRFAPSASGFAPAYSVILHANAMITEFFNHPLSQAAYEFNPRGGAIGALVDRVHKSYSASESPYLNNAKGAFAFDENWAWGRKERFRSRAHALVDILADLGAMPYVPRRELAALIRVFVHRLEVLMSETMIPAKMPLQQDVPGFLTQLSSANSGSFGVIEQRAIDFIAPLALPGGRWRGVGDSVNATNVSRRKLGDIEVERPKRLQINAIEVHGGVLSQPYVVSHQRTFARVLKQRGDELSLLAQPSEWRITVLYIAHALDGLVESRVKVGDFFVDYEFTTFEEFFERAGGVDLSGLFKNLVSVLNEKRVPQVVRDRFALLAP